MRTRLHWRVRVVKTDQTVRVGGFVGVNGDALVIVDENTGEIHEIPNADIAHHDLQPY